MFPLRVAWWRLPSSLAVLVAGLIAFGSALHMGWLNERPTRQASVLECADCGGPPPGRRFLAGRAHCVAHGAPLVARRVPLRYGRETGLNLPAALTWLAFLSLVAAAAMLLGKPVWTQRSYLRPGSLVIDGMAVQVTDGRGRTTRLRLDDGLIATRTFARDALQTRLSISLLALEAEAQLPRELFASRTAFEHAWSLIEERMEPLPRRRRR